MKLNILLGITDHLAAKFKGNLTDYIKFFKGNQGAFKGEKRTYAPKEGMLDEPTKRTNVVVQTTVDEKLTWLVDESSKYIDALFAQEATNASNTAKANLIVGNQDWGEFSALELLRLKSLLDTTDFRAMYALLPVRADNRIWEACSAEQYRDRKIMQTPLVTSVAKTTVKESFILQDPNVTANSPSYKPTVSSKDTVVEVADTTAQEFSGEISHRERALMLKRIDDLRTAVIEALKKANDVEAVPSNMTAAKLFNYIHTGSNA